MDIDAVIVALERIKHNVSEFNTIDMADSDKFKAMLKTLSQYVINIDDYVRSAIDDIVSDSDQDSDHDSNSDSDSDSDSDHDSDSDRLSDGDLEEYINNGDYTHEERKQIRESGVIPKEIEEEMRCDINDINDFEDADDTDNSDTELSEMNTMIGECSSLSGSSIVNENMSAKCQKDLEKIENVMRDESIQPENRKRIAIEMAEDILEENDEILCERERLEDIIDEKYDKICEYISLIEDNNMLDESDQAIIDARNIDVIYESLTHKTNDELISVITQLDILSDKLHITTDEKIDAIREEQSNCDLIIDQSAFTKLVREITQDYNTDVRWDPNAIEALQTASEDYLIKLFDNCNRVAIGNKRTKIDCSDIQTVRVILGEKI